MILLLHRECKPIYPCNSAFCFVHGSKCWPLSWDPGLIATGGTNVRGSFSHFAGDRVCSEFAMVTVDMGSVDPALQFLVWF